MAVIAGLGPRGYRAAVAAIREMVPRSPPASVKA